MAQAPKSGKNAGPRGRRGSGGDRGRKRRAREAAPGGGTGLTTGLFSHIEDREVLCRLDGCDNTWTWTGAEQMQALGKPPPERMCEEHLAQYHELADREVPCRNPGCEGTWTWKRGAQLVLAQRGEALEPPARLCKSCFEGERQLTDREIACRIPGCSRTWTWTREAQVKHRAWVMRSGDDGSSSEKRKKRGKKRRPRLDEPSPRLCERCQAKHARLQPRESPCKVHGCTRTATIDRDAQLQAWVALDTDDLDAEAPLTRRMCPSCREFCRANPDKAIPCGRPGCELTWTYKTGAQLQALLAGRHAPPIRLCDTCARGGFLVGQAPPGQADGGEIMPCVVPGCDGTWRWKPGMSLDGGERDGLPLARMCAACRDPHAHGEEAS